MSSPGPVFVQYIRATTARYLTATFLLHIPDFFVRPRGQVRHSATPGPSGPVQGWRSGGVAEWRSGMFCPPGKSASLETQQQLTTLAVAPCTPHTAHCTPHTAHRTPHTVQRTLHTKHCTLETKISQCPMYNAKCTMNTSKCTIHTAHCTPCTVLQISIPQVYLYPLLRRGRSIHLPTPLYPNPRDLANKLVPAVVRPLFPD